MDNDIKEIEDIVIPPEYYLHITQAEAVVIMLVVIKQDGAP
jgi:hypothetical protein